MQGKYHKIVLQWKSRSYLHVHLRQEEKNSDQKNKIVYTDINKQQNGTLIAIQRKEVIM